MPPLQTLLRYGKNVFLLYDNMHKISITEAIMLRLIINNNIWGLPKLNITLHNFEYKVPPKEKEVIIVKLKSRLQSWATSWLCFATVTTRTRTGTTTRRRTPTRIYQKGSLTLMSKSCFYDLCLIFPIESSNCFIYYQIV